MTFTAPPAETASHSDGRDGRGGADGLRTRSVDFRGNGGVADRCRRSPSSRGRPRSTMPARRFPRAAVATPHYLASAAALETLAAAATRSTPPSRRTSRSGSSRRTSAATAATCSRSCGTASCTATSARAAPRATRRRRGGQRRRDGDMPVFGPHSVTVPGAIAGWFDLLERLGTRDRSASSRRTRCGYARDGFELTPMGAQSFDGSRALYAGFDDWQPRLRHVAAGDVLRQPALAPARSSSSRPTDPTRTTAGRSPRRSRTTIRQRRRARGDRTSPRTSGEWADADAGPVPRRRDRRAAAADPGRDRARGVAHPRRLRPASARRTPVDRAAPAASRRSKLALARPRRPTSPTPTHAELAATTLLDRRRGSASARAAIDPTWRAHPARRGHPQPGGTAYLCAADADGLLVSLIQSNFLRFGSGVHVPEWGINLNNRGFSFTLDADRVNALGAVEAADAHADPGDGAARRRALRSSSARWAATRRPQVHVQVLDPDRRRRRRSQATRSTRPGGGVEPSNWKRARRDAASTDDVVDAVVRARARR